MRRELRIDGDLAFVAMGAARRGRDKLTARGCSTVLERARSEKEKTKLHKRRQIDKTRAAAKQIRPRYSAFGRRRASSGQCTTKRCATRSMMRPVSERLDAAPRLDEDDTRTKQALRTATGTQVPGPLTKTKSGDAVQIRWTHAKSALRPDGTELPKQADLARARISAQRAVASASRGSSRSALALLVVSVAAVDEGERAVVCQSRSP